MSRFAAGVIELVGGACPCWAVARVSGFIASGETGKSRTGGYMPVGSKVFWWTTEGDGHALLLHLLLFAAWARVRSADNWLESETDRLTPHFVRCSCPVLSERAGP
jgi:hypothetical protein